MKERGTLPKIGNLPGMSASQLQAVHRQMFGTEHPIANC